MTFLFSPWQSHKYDLLVWVGGSYVGRLVGWVGGWFVGRSGGWVGGWSKKNLYREAKIELSIRN